jgi:SAM-dependent methyltransferase
MTAEILRNCPACGSNQRVDSFAKNGFEICCCQTCRTLYIGRVPLCSPNEHYADYYDAENLSVPEFLLKRIDEIVAGFSSYRKTNKLLEIGFGSVTVLQAARNAKWDTSGIEVSIGAIEHARELGFDVFQGELVQAEFPAEQFDVVVASEILEHVSEPGPLLSEIRRVLRPGGVLWATTPNVDSLACRLLKQNWSAVRPPEHLQLFSRKGMASILKANGFAKIKIHSEGLNPYELKQAAPGRAADKSAAGESEWLMLRTGYKLNEAMLRSPMRRSVKKVANALLNATGWGDSLKIWAES